MGILNSGHPLIAMATLMYSNIGLQEVNIYYVITCITMVTCQAMDISNEGQDWYVDESSLKTALAAYPKLQDAVFPLLPSNCMTIKTQDITVYELLQVT